jgi:hypothetical protein
MALLNLGSSDPNLRTAAYNQLCALTATFDLKIEGQLLETSGKLFLNVCVGQIVVMKVVKCLKLLNAVGSFVFHISQSTHLGIFQFFKHPVLIFILIAIHPIMCFKLVNENSGLSSNKFVKILPFCSL